MRPSPTRRRRSSRWCWTRPGGTFLDDQPMAPAQLAERLAQAAQRNPDTEIQLRADQAVPYGRVVEVMGAAQKAGLNRIGFVADPRRAGALAPRKIARRPGQPSGTPTMQEKYNPSEVERAAQAALERARRLPRDRRRAQEEVLRLLDAALPQRQAAHGPRAQLHHQRHAHALPAHERLQRADADGLGRVRPAGRERGAEERRAAGASGPTTTSPT